MRLALGPQQLLARLATEAAHQGGALLRLPGAAAVRRAGQCIQVVAIGEAFGGEPGDHGFERDGPFFKVVAQDGIKKLSPERMDTLTAERVAELSRAEDGFAYDPEANLVYVGTGNAEPWVQKFRGAQNVDNLFTCSIIAVGESPSRY